MLIQTELNLSISLQKSQIEKEMQAMPASWGLTQNVKANIFVKTFNSSIKTCILVYMYIYWRWD